jgi:hypothetical protein
VRVQIIPAIQGNYRLDGMKILGLETSPAGRFVFHQKPAGTVADFKSRNPPAKCRLTELSMPAL